MFVHHKGQLELGSHAVRAGNQNRLRIFAGIQCKQSAEATDVGQDFLAEGCAHMRFHQFHRSVAGVDVHACVTITEASFRLLWVHERFLPRGLSWLFCKEPQAFSSNTNFDPGVSPWQGIAVG